MNEKKFKRKRIKPFVFSYDYHEIKRQNLEFAITYKELGTKETYCEILGYNEIIHPKNNFYEVLKIVVIKNEKQVFELSPEKSERLLTLLTYHNKKTIC